MARATSRSAGGFCRQRLLASGQRDESGSRRGDYRIRDLACTSACGSLRVEGSATATSRARCRMEGRLNSASRLALSTSASRSITATSHKCPPPEVVGDKMKREPRGCRAGRKQIDDLFLNRYTWARDGSIGDDKIRAEDQRLGNTDPLTRAAGKPMRSGHSVPAPGRRLRHARLPGIHSLAAHENHSLR